MHSNHSHSNHSGGHHEEKNSKLFVGNLHPKVTKEELQKMFEEFGKVHEIKLKENGK